MIEIQNVTEIMQHLEGMKAIIFDLDDTLYGEKEYVRSGYRAVAKLLPQVQDAEQKLWTAFENKKSAIDDVLVSEGVYTDELKQHCLEIYRYHQPNIHLYDGVLPILLELQELGYLIGLITDGRPEGQRAKIKSLGLEQYIDYIIITDELSGIEFRKPNEKAFVLMKEHFRVEYAEMCYVGDNIRKDFVAPEKLRMKSILFRNTDSLYSY